MTRIRKYHYRDMYLAVNEGDKEKKETGQSKERNTLGFITTTCFFFFTMSGGPVGSEGIVASYGPIIAISCSFIYPIILVPFGLLAAEFSSIYPRQGGYVYWIRAAFGGRVSYISTVISYYAGCSDSALYPAMFVDYTRKFLEIYFVKSNNSILNNVLYTSAIKLCYIFIVYVVIRNGVKFSGLTLAFSLVCLILPLFMLSIASCVKFDVHNLIVQPTDDTPGAFFSFVSLLYWNYSGIETMTALSGKIENLPTTLPKALFTCLLIAAVINSLPLFLASGADPSWVTWSDGSLVDTASNIAGKPLAISVLLSMMIAGTGMFVAEVNEDSMLLGSLFERGLTPFKVLHIEKTSEVLTIVFVTVICLFGSFNSLLYMVNMLNSINVMVVIASILKLRWQEDVAIEKPYRAPFMNKFLLPILSPFITIVFVTFVGSFVSVVSNKTSMYVVIVTFIIAVVLSWIANYESEETLENLTSSNENVMPQII